MVSSNKIKKFGYMIVGFSALLCLLIIFSGKVYAIEECRGSITENEIPCYVLLPYADNCKNVSISYYYNASYFIRSEVMSRYTGFLCNATFNFSCKPYCPITYTFNYSTGDTGSIIVEEYEMLRFFNLGVYVFIFSIVLILTYFMHKFKEDSGAPIVYGMFATALSLIMAAMIASGFDIVKGVIFFIDVNYYFIFIMISWGIYTAAVSWQMRQEKYKKADEW